MVIEMSGKYCPKCGSLDVFWAQGMPQFWSLWQCRNCGYQGAFILEDGNLALKLQQEWKKKHSIT
jgi:DNA-directed RNA polymerase subunit M